MGESQGTAPSVNETVVVELLDGLDCYMNLFLAEEVPVEFQQKIGEVLRQTVSDPKKVSPEIFTRLARLLHQATWYFMSIRSQWVIHWVVTHPDGLAATLVAERIEGYLPEAINSKGMTQQIIKLIDEFVTTSPLVATMEKVDNSVISEALNIFRDMKDALATKPETVLAEYHNIASGILDDGKGSQVESDMLVREIAILLQQLVIFFKPKRRFYWVLQFEAIGKDGVIARFFVNSILTKIPAKFRTRQTAFRILGNVSMMVFK